jgi:ectoine hydroxylase-related dioxygenase (phytanoyl-CoA dioxygenase family)
MAPFHATPPDEEAGYASAVNKFSSGGVLLNSLMNPQALSVPQIAGFTEAYGRLIKATEIAQCLAVLDGQPQHILHQTILFFICPEASAHIDSFGTDTWPRGGACTVWIPLEEIRADAGPPFIYPANVLGDLDLEFDDDSPIWNHANPSHQAATAYNKALKQHIAELDQKPVVVEVGPGDVVFWSSVTAHGSMPVQRPNASRRAIQVLTSPDGVEVGTYLGTGNDWLERQRRILSKRAVGSADEVIE